MKNKYFTFVLLCFLSFLLYGQEPEYFNERIDNFNTYDESRCIAKDTNGYIIYSITTDSVYDFFTYIAFTKINLKGEVIWSKFIGDTINSYLSGEPGSLIHVNNQKWYACGFKRSWKNNEAIHSGYLICMDNNFDTIWTKTYSEDTSSIDTVFIFRQLKRCNNGDLILVGDRYVYGSQANIWFLKTDSLGNKIWERFFGDGSMHYKGYSVIQTTDGGYALGGFKFSIGNSNSGDPLIIKTDSLGNEEWTLNPGTQYLDNKAMLALSHDGYIIAATNYATKPHGDNREAKNQLLKITNDGSLIFNKIIGEAKYDNFLTQVSIKDNDDIVATGSYRSFISSTPSTIGWVLCTHPNGNIKWYRKYINLFGEYSLNYLWDVISTDVNGLIACGQVYPQVPDTGTPDIWVLKLDSMGYDTITVGIKKTGPFTMEVCRCIPILFRGNLP